MSLSAYINTLLVGNPELKDAADQLDNANTAYTLGDITKDEYNSLRETINVDLRAVLESTADMEAKQRLESAIENLIMFTKMI